MRWSDIQFNPPRKTLRQFAVLWLIFLGGLALWHALARANIKTAFILAVLAVTVSLTGLSRPEWIRLIYVGWMVLAFPIGWLVSQVMLAAMFFGLFTPTGLAFRLVKHDPLRRTRRPELESYWAPKPMPTDVRSYFKQF
jgi:Saxitoxin biosynthesis operon protein SxtJ